jgi:hypothetical protein
MTSGVFTVLMVLHDNLRNGHYHIFGNLCNVAAYVTAGVGCSLILCKSHSTSQGDISLSRFISQRENLRLTERA